MRRWGSHMMLQYWLKMSQQRAELSGERSHFNLKSAMLWPEQGFTSWIWLRSSKKEPFVCCDQHSLSSSDPTAMVPVPKLLKTTLKPPNIWNFEGHSYLSHAGSHICKHHFWDTCTYHGLHYDCPLSKPMRNCWTCEELRSKLRFSRFEEKKKKKKKRSEHSLTYTKSLAAN